MKTGLLSLNIHDSLTFDGSELCLHPDLFAVPADVAFSSQQTVTSRNNKGAPDDAKTSTATTTSGNTTAAGSTAMGLMVGDMIEIRVWDPLPKEQALLRSPGSPSTFALWKGRSPPNYGGNISTANVQVEFPTPGISNAVPSTGGGGGNASAGNSGASTSHHSLLRPRTDALAHSIGASLKEDSELEAESNDGENFSVVDSKDHASIAEESVGSGAESNAASAAMSGGAENESASGDNLAPKSATAASSLPPVFPRNRASTTDFPMSSTPGAKTATGLPKPPLIHRRVISSGTSLFASQQPSPKLARHQRNISDMTMDTQHLDIIEVGGINQADSHDDEDNVGGDAWSKVSTTHKLRLSFVLLVTDKTLTTLKGNTRTQISMLRQVADLYSLSSYDMVTVHRIDSHDEAEVLNAVSADFVVMTIKDQFISRGDMHLFQLQLQGSWIYEGQRLTENARQIKAHALEIRHGNNAAKSGIITDKTMITFRSRSARIIWLVQLSSEMWDYASPYHHKSEPHSICEIYFDHWIRFLHKLFEKWQALEVTHSLTVVFFSRTFVENGLKSPLNCKDVYGRTYEDHFKPIIEDETCAEWESLIVRIKEEFVKYPIEVGWNLTDRRPSNASQGNVLEAVNVTLNIMQHHFLDRDLYRTGNSIVVVSPGCGVFEVDKELAGITYQRMMDNGIGSDMLSLGLPPLHIAPFFLYNNEFRNVEAQGVDASETYYEVPHWMHLSFVSYDREDHASHDHIQHEDLTSPKVKQDVDNSFEVGPNGFLRPKAEVDTIQGISNSPSMTPKSPSSFSALGNKAATPGKSKSKQERQLISGRDFRDIIEACRPRLSGMQLPSALASILRLNEVFEDTQMANFEGATAGSRGERWRNSHKQMPLTEWGTVHFNELPAIAKPFVGTRGDSLLLRKPMAEPSAEKADESESGSNASSFISHVSSIFGMSYDRVLWDHYDSPHLDRSVFKIQRSSSMEFEKLNYISPNEREDMSATTPDNHSGGQASLTDPHPETEHVFEARNLSANAKQSEKVKRVMRLHDDLVWAPISAAVATVDEIHVIRPESIQHVESDVTLSSKRGQKMSGGLGAALSQYSSAVPKEGQPSALGARRASCNLLSQQAWPGSASEKHRSQSPIYPSMSHFHERATRAMSPLLLPTVHKAHNQNTDSPGNLATERVAAQLGARDGSNGLPGKTNFQNSVVFFPAGEGPRHLLRPIARSPPNWQSGRTTLAVSPPNTEMLQRRSSLSTIQDHRPILQRNTGISRQIKASPGSPTKRPAVLNRQKKRENHTSGRHSVRQQKACNPFRQSDEEEVLAKRSHNRRRWSHVFPAGEVEFKRHSGPIWNSLTTPAILPLSVDYFPSPQELRDENTFQFNPYTVTLSGIENNYYSTHAELMLEMVRQRLVQDFQIVTASAIQDSENRPEQQRMARNKGKARPPSNRRETFVPSLPTIKHDTSGTIRHYLSMGHRIQVLSYDPNSDTIEIVHYNRKSAQNDPINVYSYNFMVFSRLAESYVQSVQTFKKYAEPYKWNKVDNMICGEEDRQLRVGMRFRRVMFGMIPKKFEDEKAEQEYITKFKRLLDYLGKLREKEGADAPLDVKVIQRAPSKENAQDDIFKIRSSSEDSMIKFTVPLRKGKREPFEWMEIAIGSTLDTSSSYRIMFNWLVASSAKVETQIQLFQRRCIQYGLQIISFPQTTISRDLFLHSFAVPTFFALRNLKSGDHLEKILSDMDFIDDGIRFTNGQVIDCVEAGHEFDFPKYRNGKLKGIPSRQYVHRSGALFVRFLRDRQGWSILVGIENHRHASKENNFRKTALEKLRHLSNTVNFLSAKGNGSEKLKVDASKN